MIRKVLCPGVAALGFLGASGVMAAEPPAAPAQAPPPRQIIRWPGGWMYVDGPSVIVRQAGSGGSTNVITSSGNGVGNRIVVDNGGTSGVTILQNVRNGIGNSVTVTPAGPVLDLPSRPQPAVPPTTEYKGRATKFWTKKIYSEAFDCNLYWCPKTQWWYRYDKAADTYRPLPPDSGPPPE